MIQKFKNFFKRIKIEKEIEFVKEHLDVIEYEYHNHIADAIPKCVSFEIVVYENLLRRLIKLKEKCI